MVPKVVIVGRPNVGKSSLFNLLCGRRVSIVDSTPGVTRDRISAHAELPPSRSLEPEGAVTRSVELIDTGGHGIEDAQNLTVEVERQIAHGLAEAHLVLFVVDAQAGIVPLDRKVAQLLRTSNAKTPVLLIANKVDGESLESAAAEASALGFGPPLCVSANTKYHKEELLHAIRSAIDFDAVAGGELIDRRDQDMLLAIVGKRNAGKSTLVNALAGSERVIVSEIEGTTRDSVDVAFEFQGRTFTAIDTAGVRKRKSLDGDIEFYSYHRSLRSIRRADVCLLLIDATLPISQVDKQLGHEILKHHKPVVIVLNKWDLVESKQTQEEYVEYLDKSLLGLTFAPIAFVSAKQGEGVTEVVAMALNLYEQASHRVGTGELNRIVQEVVQGHQPKMSYGRRGKVYYATQLETQPPTIALWVNEPELFDPHYERYLLNRFREVLPFSEVPIRLVFRKRQREQLDAE